MTHRLVLILLSVGIFSSALVAQPTITGVNAFWWLGGVLVDGGTCTGHTGGCFYAQASWTANANGAVGTPTWNVLNNPTGGGVTLSCYTCTSTEATSTGASTGCTPDITVYLTYPDGSRSSDFYVMIVMPSTFTLVSGYPQDHTYSTGWLTYTAWNLTDTCGYQDPGLDGNETFGTWTNDDLNNWTLPTATNGYNASYTWYDTQYAYGFTLPAPENPQTPLTNDTVMHDFPWQVWMGSLTFGTGVSVNKDQQQYYVDHGRHL